MSKKGKRYRTKREEKIINNQNKKTKKNKKKLSFIKIILILIFLGGIIYSGPQIFVWIKENMENRQIIENLKNTATISENTEGENKYNIDFAYLKRKNPDTVGWLKVNGTDIEHPVVQTSNNDYYLTHSFDKSYNSAGWVFLNCYNELNKDKNTVIFAHNRRDGSMFGTLKNILTKEWQNDSNNFKIPFITEGTKTLYQVFSVYSIENEDYYITTSFENDKTYEEFLTKIKSRSQKDFRTEVTPNDKILTLSTCADDNRYRVVLHAVEIK